ncbi:type I-E CRISPR-associated protein Cse2/CasB [Streptoalloteichus hindustanus]|uniref:CRISPR system Cascade subunit CasB n=1 Tax=Streptoalloteichus hindustanus TaxID=2017 RepID=A0A1M5CUL5_STRHI|nr:type I-E CRISPR-associated protein Cse2/CasB [Streptoalloteichus hindustanus]SHF58435.1 CRISPR system Cascade subunit CasB [Streptoalloteichus hindustanus]
MSEKTPSRYWTRFIGADGKWRRLKRRPQGEGKQRPPREDEQRPPGEDLAVLRSGLGRPAGTVFAVVPFYTSPIDDHAARRGEVSAEQAAEHVALALFGLHQQGQDSPMHKPGLSVGRALRRLRQSGRFAEEALDRRVTATVNATSVSSFAYRLRGLVDQLRSQGIPLDYDLLLKDVLDWHHADGRQRVRRRWGLAYFDWSSPSTADAQSVES